MEWDAETKIVTLSNDYHNIILTTGTSKLFALDVSLNITAKKLENPVQIINGRTMLPLREILENAGYEIEWDAATKTTTIKDVNDYEALKAQAEKLENLDSANLEYKVDTSKPVGKLSAEEKAYLENIYTVFKGDKYEDFGDSLDLEGADSAVVKAAMNQFIAMVEKDINSVECPESLKEVDSAVKKSIKSAADKLVSMAEVGEMLEGETDDVKGQLGFSFGFLMMMAMPVSLVDMVETMNDFYAAGNIDPEAEFGELYNNMEFMD